MLKLAAEMGNGLITMGPRWSLVSTAVEEYRRCVETIKRHRESLSKNGEFAFACLIAPPENLENFAGEIEDYKEAGMDYLVLGMVRVSTGLELIERFKNEIISSFS
jgi:hypothetical protein